MNPVRKDFAQRLQYETPPMHLRMRQGKPSPRTRRRRGRRSTRHPVHGPTRCPPNAPPVASDEIEIQRPWRIRSATAPARLSFDLLEEAQRPRGRHRTSRDDDSIEIAGLATHAK